MKISKKTQARINAGLDKHRGARMMMPSEIKAHAHWPLVQLNHAPALQSAAQVGELADRAFSLPSPVLMASPNCTHHSTAAASQRPRKSLLDMALEDLYAKGLIRG